MTKGLTCAANRKPLNQSQSFSISSSSSSKIYGSRTELLAARRCSERIRSTVVLNSGDVWPACGTVKGVSEGNGVGDEDLGEDEVRAQGLLGNEGVSEQDILRKSPFVTGV